MFKPMLASDYDRFTVEKHLPLYVQPKIDGCRGLNLGGSLVGRSLKPFRNIFLTADFSLPEFTGFDGELWATTVRDTVVKPTSPSLCRDTTSEVNSKVSDPYTIVRWSLFDYAALGMQHLPYKDRLRALQRVVESMWDTHRFNEHHPVHRIDVVESERVYSLTEIDTITADYLDEGYEGTILRKPMGLYKHGRSTAKEGGLLRIKEFKDAEAVVIGIHQGQANHNQAMVNELGHTERSTHKVNMLDSGQVGSLECRSLVDGSVITVGPGAMTHAERVYYWQHQDELLGKTIKFKFFPKGMKEKPRFPTFICIRVDTDIG